MEGYLLNEQIFHLHVARAGCDTGSIGMPALGLWKALERKREERDVMKDWGEFLELHTDHFYGCPTGFSMWP